MNVPSWAQRGPSKNNYKYVFNCGERSCVRTTRGLHTAHRIETLRLLQHARLVHRQVLARRRRARGTRLEVRVLPRAYFFFPFIFGCFVRRCKNVIPHPGGAVLKKGEFFFYVSRVFFCLRPFCVVIVVVRQLYTVNVLSVIEKMCCVLRMKYVF